MEKEIILSVKDLDVKFKLRGKTLHAIRKISLDIYKGEVIAIVGESGSGKSVFTKNFLGLLDSNGYIDGGSIVYNNIDNEDLSKKQWQNVMVGNGIDLAKLSQKQWQKAKVRGKEISMIMQDPMTSLNPLKSVGDQIAEAIMLHRNIPKAQAKVEAIRCLKDVEIGDEERRYKQYPHEFSGGMRQRVVIAMAIACNPKVLICDEPTTALDVTIQAQVLKLIKKLKDKYNLTVIFITHDLGVVANIADRVAVMYAGDIIELGNCDEIFFDPKHPYTKALLKSLPNIAEKGSELHSIKGTPPSLFTEIKGDAFAPRNPDALKIDFIQTPPYFEVTPTHKAKTWLLDPRYLKYKDGASASKARIEEAENAEANIQQNGAKSEGKGNSDG